MRSRMKQIMSLTILVTSGLVGCASVQITNEYAASDGYRSVEIKGREYFCRREQPEVPGSPEIGVKCFTGWQFRGMVAGANYARLGLYGQQTDFGPSPHLPLADVHLVTSPRPIPLSDLQRAE